MTSSVSSWTALISSTRCIYNAPGTPLGHLSPVDTHCRTPSSLLHLLRLWGTKRERNLFSYNTIEESSGVEIHNSSDDCKVMSWVLQNHTLKRFVLIVYKMKFHDTYQHKCCSSKLSPAWNSCFQA